MKYQLHDSQIDQIGLGENTIVLHFSQGFWATDEHEKMSKQLKNCEIVYEIDNDDSPIEDFISIRVSKRGGVYKNVSLQKFVALLKKSPFNIYLEYDCDFASRKMLQLHSNALRVDAEIFVSEIKNVDYIHD